MKFIKTSLVIALALPLLAAGCNKTQAPTVNTSEAPAVTADTSKSYTMAEVAANNNASKCWSVINGQVYDLTSFIGKHPGGDKGILSICGKDGTKAFEGQHAGQAPALETLTTFKLGSLKQ